MDKNIKLTFAKKMNMKQVVIFVALSISMASCSGLKDVTKFKEKDVVISLHKGPCAGKCSVFNLDIYKNRYVVYEGIANVEKYGLYAKILTKDELALLQTEFDNADFFSFDNKYPVPNPDLPVITIINKKNVGVKKVIGSIDRPKKVLDLQKMLEMLIKTEGFQLIKAYPVKTGYNGEDETQLREISQDSIEFVFENQIVLQLEDNVFMAQWLRKYPQYEVRLNKQLDPNLPYFLISFNRYVIEPEEFLKIVQNDHEIKAAEFNKIVKPRN